MSLNSNVNCTQLRSADRRLALNINPFYFQDFQDHVCHSDSAMSQTNSQSSPERKAMNTVGKPQNNSPRT